MNLNSILKTIKETYTPPKTVEFPEAKLVFSIETLTPKEEIKVMGACQELDGMAYMEGIKRHSLACAIKKINEFDLDTENVEYTLDNGEKKIKSKYLYMLDFLSDCPQIIVDSLSDAFTSMQIEVEAKIKKDMKFEAQNLSKEPEKEPETMEKILETEDSDDGLTEAEILDKKVKAEAEAEELRIAQSK